MHKKQYKFLLISSKTADALKINHEITRNKWYSVTTVNSASEAVMAIDRGGIDCLVFNFETFNLAKTKIIQHVREVGGHYPVVIFASLVQKEAFTFIQKMSRVVIIEKPFESKDVWGICEKFVQGRKVYQRVFRRFFTDQVAAIEKTSSGEKLQANIYNLSRGGAYIELQAGKAAPGDILNVTINLDKMYKAYKVDAVVVWASPRGFWRGNPAVGVQFMKTNDVYRNLLDKL